MSFRKRNVVISQTGSSSLTGSPVEKTPTPGVRPSPLDGRLTTSTGTMSLDALLAGHGGLALGCSLFIEESGTTDFGGVLLRYYAAEGVIQGHHVHVLGLPEAWGRELPGLAAGDGKSLQTEEKKSEEKMKIAWRYERLGEFGASGRDRTVQQKSASTSNPNTAIFCHDFDFSKRLTLPSPSSVQSIPVMNSSPLGFATTRQSKSPFAAFLLHLSAQLSNSTPQSIHRVIIPNLLSPAIYPADSFQPEFVLQFLHALRAILRRYSSRITAMITLPLTLYPRHSGLTRWMELLNDGVLELAPFPVTTIPTKATLGDSNTQEEPPQGMLNVHRLPIFHENGGGGGELSRLGDDLAFTLSRRKGLVLKPYSLPPVATEEAQHGATHDDHGHGKSNKADIEF
ncbi:Elongator complex protein 4 [Xylogone sp. PMI_703]|nr:Elongator complex protein 4 [Xylogone sp. PMI_703]